MASVVERLLASVDQRVSLRRRLPTDWVLVHGKGEIMVHRRPGKNTELVGVRTAKGTAIIGEKNDIVHFIGENSKLNRRARLKRLARKVPQERVLTRDNIKKLRIRAIGEPLSPGKILQMHSEDVTAQLDK